MITEEDIAQMLSDLTVSVQKGIWESYFPEEGPFARSAFPRHMEFLEATREYPVCTLFGANRIGKSMLLSYAAACWAMGKYPSWWKGRVFEKPVKIWIAGKTTDLVKESTMQYLFGSDGVSGMISADHIEHIFWSQQSPGVISRVLVRSPGGLSEITFKTYDMGWERFQSGTVDVVILDEEMPTQIFTESYTRTLTTNGTVLCGFTGLKGVTPLVAHLWPAAAGLSKAIRIAQGEEIEDDATAKSRYHIFIGWKDVPYSVLSKERRAAALATYPSNEIKARTEGIPSVGSGMVYQVHEDEFSIEPFEIPAHWRKGFALDPGFKGKTAALWAAYDEDSDVIYLYSEHYQGEQRPPLHVDSLRRRGSWIPCIIDPAGANVEDGRRVKTAYKEALHAVNPSWPLYDAIKTLTAGIMEVDTRLATGRLKVFNTLHKWFSEFRIYHRDDQGKIVATPDHLMDCFVRGTRIATPQGDVPIEKVHAGMLVTTRNGPCEVFTAWETGEREVWELSLSDGTKLVGTGSHPVWSEGWKRLDSMRYGDTLETCRPSASSSTETPSGAIQTVAAARTAFTTVLRAVSGCMLRYGRRLTAPLQAVSTFITSMMIHWITGWRILPASPHPITCAATTKAIAAPRSGRISPESCLWPKHGIPAPKGWRGTLSTRANAHWLSQFFTETATGAARTTPPRTPARIASATKTAKQPPFVVAVAKLPKPEKVFNLQVIGTPEYYANGIRVHNCTRYVCMGLKHYITKPPERGHTARVTASNPFGL